MSRTPVSLRQATLDDAVFLTDLWQDALRRADVQDQATDLEPTLHAIAPFVSPRFRRRGVGHILMEAAVSHAEELGIAHVLTLVSQSSRSSNRFMARLALGPQAMVRVATTPAVRSKLTAQLPGKVRPVGARPMGQVLAARRSLRRTQAPEG